MPLVFVALAILLGGCSDGPNKSQVIKDWEAYIQENSAKEASCFNDVKFKNVQVVGKSTTENISEVNVRIYGDWIGGRDPGWFGGPCAGFQASRGNDQSVNRRFIYKRFDTGWILESNTLL